MKTERRTTVFGFDHEKINKFTNNFNREHKGGNKHPQFNLEIWYFASWLARYMASGKMNSEVRDGDLYFCLIQGYAVQQLPIVFNKTEKVRKFFVALEVAGLLERYLKKVPHNNKSYVRFTDDFYKLIDKGEKEKFTPKPKKKQKDDDYDDEFYDYV